MTWFPHVGEDAFVSPEPPKGFVVALGGVPLYVVEILNEVPAAMFFGNKTALPFLMAWVVTPFT